MLKKAHQRPLGRGLEPRAPFRASNQSTSGLFREFFGTPLMVAIIGGKPRRFRTARGLLKGLADD